MAHVSQCSYPKLNLVNCCGWLGWSYDIFVVAIIFVIVVVIIIIIIAVWHADGEAGSEDEGTSDRENDEGNMQPSQR